jgi:hypothetical protein
MVDVDAATAEVTDGDAVTTLVTATVTADPKPCPRSARSRQRDPDRPADRRAVGADRRHRAPRAVAPRLASTFGGRSVATAAFAPADAHLPITIAAREGEPAILTAAGDQYELPGP